MLDRGFGVWQLVPGGEGGDRPGALLDVVVLTTVRYRAFHAVQVLGVACPPLCRH